MRRAIALLALAAAVTPAAAVSPLYVSADVPTTVAAGPTLQPWEIWRYTAAGPTYTLALSLPGQPTIDAIHKLDAFGGWLFSLETPSNLGGALLSDADPRDIVRYNAIAGTYTTFFCGPVLGIPPEANIDAVHLASSDASDLIVSFDVPVTLGAFNFEPADLVRYNPTGGAGCAAWALDAANPAFDASAAGAGIPISDNVVGSDVYGGRIVLAIDVPSDLAPSAGPVTYMPGQIAQWSGALYGMFEALAGWPAGSVVDGVSMLANPGRIPATITVNKAVAPAGDLIVAWQASCSEGGEDYGIYEGLVGSWYSHTLNDCFDAGSDLSEQITPLPGNRYYLVVPRNATAEGSYGRSLNFPIGFNTERPVGTAQCVAPQIVTACP